MIEVLDTLKILGWKLLALIVTAPFAGIALVSLSEEIEKAWKSNNRKKKWVAMSLLYFGIAVLCGALR